MELPAALQASGDELVQLASVDSTMEEARRRFAPGRMSRLWIVADTQEAGRGRGGRRWTSPPGNLHLTLLAPVAIPPRDQPKLGFAAGVALAEAAAGLLPHHIRPLLKWPNDLLLNGAKSSGILLEGSGGGEAVAMGIGVNVVDHPLDTPYPSTHLRAFDASINRDRLFERLSQALVDEIDSLTARGFGPTRARWLARAAHLGEVIAVRRDCAELQGRFLALDADGRLLIETADGVTAIDAGDVFPLDIRGGEGQGLEIKA